MKQEGTIDFATGATMTAVTFIFFDAPQILLTVTGIGMTVSPVITPFAAVTVALWFSANDVSMLEPSRVGRFIATAVGEIAPGVNAIPFWSIVVAYTAYEHRTSKQEL